MSFVDETSGSENPVAVQSTTAPVVNSGDTIMTQNVGEARVAPSALITNVILQPGVQPGQEVIVINESVSGDSLTFAASGSHVAEAASLTIAGGTKVVLVWDSITGLWY